MAKRDGLSSGAMTNRLDRLEKAGLVKRLPDLDDRRAHVELTDNGHRLWADSPAPKEKEATCCRARRARAGAAEQAASKGSPLVSKRG